MLYSTQLSDWLVRSRVIRKVFLCFCFQLWDIRDGMCKQTFSGHESDINAITVSACRVVNKMLRWHGGWFMGVLSEIMCLLGILSKILIWFFCRIHLLAASCYKGFLNTCKKMSWNFNMGCMMTLPCLKSVPARDLARNEEFSEIAVINIFFTVLKTKIQLSVGGGVLRGKFRDNSRNWHANKQEGYEHSPRPVCQYTIPCLIIWLNVIAIDKYMIILL